MLAGKKEVIDFEQVKRRSVVGIFSLVSRSFLIQIISQASVLFLTIFLEPKVFGIFFLVSAFINFFTYFSDIGLAAALIQKKENISEEDTKTTFLVQESLVVLLLVIMFAFSSAVSRWYKLDSRAIFLFYSLGISFFLSSLKTIPSVLLERELKFNLLIIPQIFETLVFNLVSVVLAWKNFGITSFTWAVLARGITGLVLMYIVSPWKPGISFSRKSFLKLLKFGIPYQANTLIAVLKDDLMTVFLGRIIGVEGLGYLGWAKKWAELPLRFFMDNVSKIVFPAFSRMQDEREKLKISLEKALFFLSFLTLPILFGFAVLASDLVKVIPRYLKWQPALLALYLYSFNSGWATISTSLTNFLNATGKIKTTFKLMLMWLTLTWALMPILAVKFGFNGVAVASAIISFSSIAVIIIVKKEINFNLFGSVGKPLIASFLMAAVIFFIKVPLLNLTMFIILRIILGGLSYLLFSYLLIGRLLFKDASVVLHEVKKNR